MYQEEGALQKANQIENYYGFENGIRGKELYQAGMKQAVNIGVEIKKEEVTGIQIAENGFEVRTTKEEYRAYRIILATGNKKCMPRIKNIEDFEGRGISYCAICDGFFYRNKKVSIIGSGNYAISELNDLINLADKITILTNGEKEPELRADIHGDIEINTKEIEAIAGSEKVEEVKFKDGTKLKTDGVFIAERSSRKYGVCQEIRDNYSEKIES